ncbi:DUF4129 domain-containing protein [Chryseobacterium nematophagum]|uniref:DUF4129 domain-containing protein n=1 Tax=Chryseobacterium nematophagum TaxID=2305228 RepID=A0A3M7TDA6_9FLAO|nr:DUF4129 domain-containing protein [Chryseobacterium nematophagum]RNA60629.1 DUF4129 domain-containing protein [Chryseobacterium nematophagum]
MNKIFFFLLIFSLTGNMYAQGDSDLPPTAPVYVDSMETGHYKNMLRADSVLIKTPISENTVYPKKFKENFQSAYKSNEFNYSESKPRESFWQKLMRRIDKILQRIFGETIFTDSANIASILIRFFAIILVGFLVYFIIRYVIGKEGNYIFGKKNKKVEIQEEQLHENIHEINFPESILKFEKSRDFRSAIRYQFLFVLKKLSDKKIISWNPEKTNKDYVSEMKAEHLKNEFYNLSYIFDYVWYGEFNINEESYLKFKNQYQSFKL